MSQHLAALLVREIRYSRRLRLHVAYAREQRAALREALSVSVKTIADLSKTLDRSRATSQSLRDELRRYTAAKVDRDTGPTDSGQPEAPGVH